MQVRGVKGALLLGLAYGFFSGVCTFGFIAPILGFMAIQDTMLQGVFMMILFALGHCLPLAGAGMFSARLMGLLYGSSWQHGIIWARRGAALGDCRAWSLFFVVPLPLGLRRGNHCPQGG
jgi:cytochrome c-type biogenesis protein